MYLFIYLVTSLNEALDCGMHLIFFFDITLDTAEQTHTHGNICMLEHTRIHKHMCNHLQMEERERGRHKESNQG